MLPDFLCFLYPDVRLTDTDNGTAASPSAFRMGIFPPPCLHLSSDIDFSIMLANSFENAVNGCIKLSDPKQREIRVTCLEENQMLYEIANTCLEEAIVFDENHFPLSQNPGHGIGTRSIIAFAQKNNAALDYQIEDGFFRLRILPPTHAAEASQ